MEREPSAPGFFYVPSVPLPRSSVERAFVCRAVAHWETLGRMKSRPLATFLAVFPNAAMVVLFYSLALHMRLRLGVWPQSIGDQGFPASLSTHGHIAWRYCSAWVGLSLILVPVGMVACLVTRSLRPSLRYFALYALGWLLCVGLMALAPAPFLNWWWD